MPGLSGRPAGRPGRPADETAWLRQGPTAAELRAAYPEQWAAVHDELAPMIAQGDLPALEAYTRRLAAQPTRRASGAAVEALVRRQIAAAILRQASLSAVTGRSEGRVRFNLLNGFVAQKLLFRKDLERKQVSLFWFRLLWPLLWQRQILMPLVSPKGIFCFYSRALVRRLAEMIGERPCLEIAAGDGTLTCFLNDAGVSAVATDDHSWTHSVTFSDSVIREDARTALRTRSPQAVICSWPPAGNGFEAAVFNTASVELYIVIASRAEYATGAREAYVEQTTFTFEEDPALSRLVLPPELDAAVYVFRRKPTGG